MAKVDRSELLELIIAAAKRYDRNRKVATAESFIIAMLDHYAKLGSSNTELAEAVALLGKYKTEPVRIREILVQFVTSNEPQLGDQIFMQRVDYASREMAKGQKKDTVTVAVFLECILRTPTVAIQSALDNRPMQKQTPKLDIDILDDLDIPTDDGGDDTAGKGTSGNAQNTGTNASQAKEQMLRLVDDIHDYRDKLRKKVFGQENAIQVVCNGLFQANMLKLTGSDRKHPFASFLFAGPPGVGKTFLASQLAKTLGNVPFMKVDMSEYADDEAHLEFCGYDKAYRGAKEGNVTGFVYKNPRCVILFDEIEKAHMVVINLFLQMLDQGVLRDNYLDEEVSFSNAIVLMTTNAGKKLYEESDSGDFSSISRKTIINALQKDVNPVTEKPFFPAAICSRFASGNVVMFNRMAAHDLQKIAMGELETHAQRLHDTIGISSEFDELTCTALMFAEGGSVDARTIRARAEAFINREIYDLLTMLRQEKAAHQNLSRIQFRVDIAEAAPEIQKLFRDSEKKRTLVFADGQAAALLRAQKDCLETTVVADLEEAKKLLRDQEWDMVVLDLHCGVRKNSGMNIEDLESDAQDLFTFMREERCAAPLFILDTDGKIKDESVLSLLQKGVRKVLPAHDEAAFKSAVQETVTDLHQTAAVEKLARENKLLTFSTAQTISEDGTTAVIRLYGFNQEVVVDAEDSQEIMTVTNRPNVYFKDVIGADDAQRELQYFVEYLRNPKKYMGTGVKAPKGVLLYGPPGTGKTMLAKAMATEAGVTFIATEGNKFLKKTQSETAEAVHTMFRKARKYAPAILFVDEIDSVAKERGGMRSGVLEEQALNSFLTEMDGFSATPSKPVFVLAATNYDVTPGTTRSLDPALLRRFDRRIMVDLPDVEARIRFMKEAVERNKALQITPAMIEHIAMRSTGMSLAQLTSVVELALRSAIRAGSTVVTDAIFDEAFETFNNGDEKKWDESLLLRVARHEAGHAFMCCQAGETPSYMTIVARGDHGGYMQHSAQDRKELYTKDELLGRIRTSLGGRAAEIAYYGEQDGLSTGASGDLRNATRVAQRILCNYGMDENFGVAVVNADEAAGELADELREAVNRILKEQMQITLDTVKKNKDKIDRLVARLMVKNHLTGDQIRAAIDGTDAE